MYIKECTWRQLQDIMVVLAGVKIRGAVEIYSNKVKVVVYIDRIVISYMISIIIDCSWINE